MCILFILRRKSNKWPLMIATNRDEFFERDFFQPGYHWKKYPNIFAGQDKKAGGSWLGINKSGLCIAILNRTSNNIKNKKKLESRGDIVINLLKYKNALNAKNIFLNNFKKKYNFFNLFIADNKNAFWIKYDNYLIESSPIPYGYSILDNQNLNDKNSLRQKINKKTFQTTKHPLPEKNDFQGWKKLLMRKKQMVDSELASIYVNKTINDYGTVCSSIIVLPSNKNNNKNIFWIYRDSLSAKPSFRKLKI